MPATHNQRGFLLFTPPEAARVRGQLGSVLAEARFFPVVSYPDTSNCDHFYQRWSRAMSTTFKAMLAGSEGGANDQVAPSLQELNRLCQVLNDVNLLADSYITTQMRSWQAGGEGGR